MSVAGLAAVPGRDLPRARRWSGKVSGRTARLEVFTPVTRWAIFRLFYSGSLEVDGSLATEAGSPLLSTTCPESAELA